LWFATKIYYKSMRMGFKYPSSLKALYANSKKRKENDDKLHARVRSQTKGVQVEAKQAVIKTRQTVVGNPDRISYMRNEIMERDKM
jgi:hypothetical protein